MKTSVCAVVVTFQPDQGGLATLLEALRPQVDALVLVDNGSNQPELLHDLAANFDSQLILLEENQGIARAQNLGIALAFEQGFDAVLLSDQDSIPSAGMVAQLVRTLVGASKPDPFFPAAGNLLPSFTSEASKPIAAVGPVPVDERGSEESSLVYSFTTWGPKRRTIPQAGEVLEVPFVLASGCLIPRDALLNVGPMNESLFIDHVDLAWCLRALEKGYRILVDGFAKLTHSLGEEKTVLPTGREIHVQSPMRNYYMVRNTMWLTRAPFMPTLWKLGYLPYLAKYLGFYSLLSLKQPSRFKELCRGFEDGLRGASGPSSPSP